MCVLRCIPPQIRPVYLLDIFRKNIRCHTSLTQGVLLGCSVLSHLQRPYSTPEQVLTKPQKKTHPAGGGSIRRWLAVALVHRPLLSGDLRVLVIWICASSGPSEGQTPADFEFRSPRSTGGRFMLRPMPDWPSPIHPSSGHGPPATVSQSLYALRCALHPIP